jgi:single-stranded-DNA-specific exonuclease
MTAPQSKTWRLADQFDSTFARTFPTASPLELQLLWNRKITTKKAHHEYFHSTFDEHVYDPTGLTGIAQAAERIWKAKKNREHIIIYGDFDVDGITSSVILSSAFDALDIPYRVYIPHRDENHGLHIAAIDKFAKEHISLVITVDCGVSNTQEVAHAASKGIDVIITDHHEIPDILPKAAAIVNPKLPNDTYQCDVLCGAGVSYKLSQLLIRQSKKTAREKEQFEKWMLDIVAIGTIGDCVPLQSENRTLTKYGLIVLNKTKRIGIHELLKASKKQLGKLTSFDVAFHIVPRLNAASRLDHADVAFALLKTTNKEEAQLLARKLDQLNKKRRVLTDDITKQAIAQIEKNFTDEPIIWASGKDWPTGINGIVASRIAETFGRPTFIMHEDEEQTSASGRSVAGFDITKAVASGKKFLVQFGGHPGACGFVVNNKSRQQFLDRVLAFTKKTRESNANSETVLDIDAVIDPADLSWDTYELIQQFQPFGQDNEEPVLRVKKAMIENIQVIGRNNDHLRLQIGSPNGPIGGIWFSAGDRIKEMRVGDSIDIVGYLRKNEWNGSSSLQIEIADACVSALASTKQAQVSTIKKSIIVPQPV